ncbi:MAG: two-component regulator propeller domain-containing protein [Anaerolineae bacterium]|nr:two-component regulator propeller domain-containing protein [Anaerolineae bacterium]
MDLHTGKENPRTSASNRVLSSLILPLLLAGSLALPPPACAGLPTPRFFHLTTADGLSHNIVYAIVQDPQGFLWFGTQDGLNRYDGYTFTIFRHLRSDPHSPVHNTVQALAVDRSGTLWVGTVGGIDRYDRNTGGFIHYPEIAESVTVVYPAPDGILWVGTAGAGLFRYDPRADRFLRLPNPLPDAHILALHQDADGTLWVGTEYSGLWALPPGHRLPYGYRHDPTDPHSLPHDRVTAILRDRTGILWVGTGAHNEPTVGGLAALDLKTGRFTPYRQGLTHLHITALAEDHAGTLWVGTESGLAVLDRSTGRFVTYRHDPLDPYGPVNNRVYTLYEDRTGILWIGTDGGVSRYVPHKNRFALYRYNPLDPNSLGAPRVGAVLKDREGNLWVGLHGGGLDRIASDGTVTHYRRDPDNPHSLSHNHVTALYQDPSGALWVGTSAGLDRLDPDAGGFIHFAHDPADPHTIGPGAVKVIYRDRSGALWIGTEEPGTLSRLDPKTGRFTVHRYDPRRPDGFPNTYGIRAILEDREGFLWLGTYNGLVRLDPRTGIFTHYRHDPDDPHSLSDDFVWSLYEDADGTLWVGTHSGLNRLDDRDAGRFTIYTIEDGLPSDGIVAILGDEEGCLWLATMGGGLSRFDPNTGTFRTYDESDGLQDLHFIIGAAHRGADGELFFGGTSGLNRFHPTDVRENPHAPPVVLTAFRVFDQVRDFGRDLTGISEIHLSYQENFFSFEFVALDYADPAKNQYAYILEGFDRDWVHSGTRRYAAYTNVPPGTYTFRVRASNNDGVWNEEGLAVQVVITPPFWQTGWFRALAALAAMGIALVVVVARMRYVAALRRSEERFRTLFEQSPVGVCEVDLSGWPPQLVHANPAFLRLFGQTPESLSGMSVEDFLMPTSRAALKQLCRMPSTGESVTLEVMALRADGISFPARLRAAVGPGGAVNRCILVVEDLTAEKALRSEEEAIAEERRRIAREIHDGLAQDLAALRMRARLWHKLVDESPQQMHAEIDALRDVLSRNIREVRRAIFALRPVALDELGFYPALRQFAAEFTEQNQVYVDLRVKGEEVRLPAFLEAVLFRIIQEALHNVAKHAQASMVKVELNVEEAGTVRLSIRDDGVGFDPAILEQAERSGHLGLKQMRERVEALGGRIEIHSQPGKGTEIQVILRRH